MFPRQVVISMSQRSILTVCRRCVLVALTYEVLAEGENYSTFSVIFVTSGRPDGG